MFTISVDPVAFTIGSIEVRWYGILIALAVLSVILWMVRQVKTRTDLPSQPDIILAPVGIISGIIGAKLVHVLEQPTLYIQNPAAIFSGGGLAIYGGVLGATLGIYIYVRLSRHLKQQHTGFFIDLIAPGIILAQAIGRIGCTINGCCYGKPTPLPWSLVYTHPNSFAYYTSLALPPGTGLHPTQVYEIIFCLIGFAILLKLRGRLKPDGSLFLVYLIMYSAWRLGVGFLRVADVYFISGLSQAQNISLVVLAVSIALLVYIRHRFKVAEQTSL